MTDLGSDWRISGFLVIKKNGGVQSQYLRAAVRCSLHKKAADPKGVSGFSFIATARKGRNTLQCFLD